MIHQGRDFTFCGFCVPLVPHPKPFFSWLRFRREDFSQALPSLEQFAKKMGNRPGVGKSWRSLPLVGEWVGQVCLEAAAGSLQVGDRGRIQAEPGSQCCERRAGLRRLEEGRLCRRLPRPRVHRSASDCSPAASWPLGHFPGWTGSVVGLYPCSNCYYLATAQELLGYS